MKQQNEQNIERLNQTEPDTTQQKDLKETFKLKEHYELDELLALVAFLRSEDGCPWDRAQNHESIKKNLVEEAYETVDAINDGDQARICDELGDVLMQVVFHAQMAQEANSFTFNDVVSGICRKLISRHTHLFGDDVAEDPEGVLATWEANKMKEKGFQRYTDALLDVPRALPALMRGGKLQKRAADTGFDWPTLDGPRQKIIEELEEIEAARHHAGRRQLEEEVGDFLFSCVNYARHLGIEPEMALHLSNEKFIRRFAGVEALARLRGLNLAKLNLDELDRLWDEVKSVSTDKGE